MSFFRQEPKQPVKIVVAECISCAEQKIELAKVTEECNGYKMELEYLQRNASVEINEARSDLAIAVQRYESILKSRFLK